MIILGIESSCDETAAAVVEKGRTIRSSVVATQFQYHAKYSGVVPELASRAHVLTINQVIEDALKKAKLSLTGRRRVDAVAVTVGPGLVGSLLVGKMTAEALGWVHRVPTIGVNHIEGHLLSPVLVEKKLKPPFLGLVVSGGHTELIYAKTWGDYKLMGATRDDAAGEAFDKVAKMMKLGYPGGPIVDRLAKKGKAAKAPFPRPWLPGTWDFSFSGLKTAVLYKLRERKTWSPKQKQDLCAGFQESVVDVLAGKALAAAKALNVDQIVVGGGVAANSRLREVLSQRCRQAKVALFMVPPAFCTDNAAMIASSAYFIHKVRPKKEVFAPLKVQPNLRISPIKRTLPAFRAPA